MYFLISVNEVIFYENLLNFYKTHRYFFQVHVFSCTLLRSIFKTLVTDMFAQFPTRNQGLLMVTGNVSVFQKTGDTRGLLCFTLELNWQFIKFKSVKKYCHKALKGKKSGVWRMYKQFEPNSKQFKMKSSIQLNKTSNFICQSG